MYAAELSCAQLLYCYVRETVIFTKRILFFRVVSFNKEVDVPKTVTRYKEVCCAGYKGSPPSCNRKLI